MKDMWDKKDIRNMKDMKNINGKQPNGQLQSDSQQHSHESKMATREHKVKGFAKAAVTAILAVGMGTKTAVAAPDKKVEKCYGIAKKGMNDCGANNHSCSGQSTKDNDPTEWIFLPTGTCNKIVGGSTTPPKPKKES